MSLREEGDYNCSFMADPNELKVKMEPAKRMISAIETLIN